MSAHSTAPQLRPLGIGEILDVGIKIYTRNWLTLWKIVVFVVLPAQILVNLVSASSVPNNFNTVSISPNGTVITDTHDVAVALVGGLAAGLIGYLATLLAQAACFRAIADAYLGEEARWSSSLRFALRRLPAVFVLTVAAAFLEFFGLIACIIPGVYLWAAFSVAIPALLVEGAGPFRALGRSRRLVKGRWWTAFGVAIVGALLVAIISAALAALVVGVVFAHPARDTATGFVLNTLASTVGSMLTTPAAAAFATVLYIDLRVRKEGFDLYLLAQRLGVEREPGAAPPVPDFIPEAPAWTADKPPFWPPPPGWTPSSPPPGWTPSPPEPQPPAAPPAESDQPPYWPPPPGWKPPQR